MRLTDSEFAELEQVAQENGACSRNLLITEAIKIGLQNSNVKPLEENRRKRIMTRIPRRAASKLREVARKNDLTRSQLVRHFLFQYLHKLRANTSVAEVSQCQAVSAVTMAAGRTSEQPSPVTKLPLITEKDASEYERIRSGLVKVLEKRGDYEPIVDDLLFDQIARGVIYSRKTEVFLDAETADEQTYSSITDTKLKLTRMVDEAIRDLALTRAERLSHQAQADIMSELREAILRGLDSAGR
jgi:metal-responsive CopG/Arc/MetJ family transcriptional regulator/uncharacterized protein YjiS (DUF1127 family)